MSTLAQNTRPGRRTATRAHAAAAVLGLVGVLAAPAAVAASSAPAAPAGSTPTATAAGSSVVGGARLAAPGVQTNLPAGVPAPPALAAASYLLADLTTGQVLVAKSVHATGLPASTMKALTALVTMPLVDPADLVTAQREDLVDGTKVGLDPGSQYTVAQLQQAMVLSSANDAAMALSRAAGGVPQTVARMQSQARALGALDTVVRNPTGLDAPGQVTSAYDLALVARAAMKLPAFRTLVATERVRFPGKQIPGQKRKSYQIQNHNNLIYNYPGAIGVKNGYTVAARWAVIGAASRGGRTYLLTALKRGDGSWRPEAAMLDWAFAYGAAARPVGRLVEPGEVQTQQAPATPGVAARQARAAARAVPASQTGRTRSVVAGAGVAAALLAMLSFGLLLFGLSAHARRRQLHAARVARSRRPRRR